MNAHMKMAVATTRQQDLLSTAADRRRAAAADAPQGMLSRMAEKLGAIAGGRRPAPQPVASPVRRSASVAIGAVEIVAPR